MSSVLISVISLGTEARAEMYQRLKNQLDVVDDSLSASVCSEIGSRLVQCKPGRNNCGHG